MARLVALVLLLCGTPRTGNSPAGHWKHLHFGRLCYRRIRRWMKTKKNLPYPTEHQLLVARDAPSLC